MPLPRSIMRELDAHLGQYTEAGADAYVFTGPTGVLLRRSAFRRYWWLPAVAAPAWSRCGSTISGTPSSPCGSLPGRTSRRCRFGRVTRASLSALTDMATSTKTVQTLSRSVLMNS